MSQAPVSEPCSPALMQRRQEPSSPTVLVGKFLSPSTAPGLLSLGAPEPWSFAAGPCGQPCTGTGLCGVQHCRALPALTAFLPPFAPYWHFPCCHHIPTCTLSPFSWLLPPGRPMGVPQFPLGVGKWRDFAPWSSERAELPPGCLQPNRALWTPTSLLEPCHARCAMPGKCSCSKHLPGCRGFQVAARSFSLLSTHLKH